MPDNEYVASLQILISKIDSLSEAGSRREEAGSRREELLSNINGYVRDHGEQLAANKQWIWGHKQTHETIDKRIHTLSTWLWGLSGGTGILATVFAALQSIRV